MATDIALFLQPVAGDSSCGLPLEDGSVRALHALATDNSHDQFATPRVVNWIVVRERCEELLSKSRHLDVAMPYAVALLETEGLPGFVSGLELIAGLLTTAWAQLHPRVDELDGNDPTERIGILDTLSAPLSTFGDPWQVLMRLRRAELVRPASGGSLAVGTVLARCAGAVTIPGIQIMDAPGVIAALRRVPEPVLTSVLHLLNTGKRHLNSIESVFRERARDGRTPNLAALGDDFSSLSTAVNGALAPASGAKSEPPGGAGHTDRNGSLPTATRGEISSSDQVLAALEQIGRYYHAHQQGSPLPLLLARMQRLVKADFLTIVADLAPNALSDFKAATGFQESASRPGS